MKLVLAVLLSLVFAIPAYAGNVESRADAIQKKTEGNNSYHAHMARDLADIAVKEMKENDPKAARRFIIMAEEHAAQAGGAQ